MQYIETLQFQFNKQDNAVCGDDILIKREKGVTVILVMDGVGSGVQANLCATLFGHELMCFLEKGYSLSESCRLVIESIKSGKKINNFAAFNAATVLDSGHVQVFTYEAPPPVFINDSYAYVPHTQVHRLGSENIIESNYLIRPGKALLLFSDGVSQSGMGHGFGYGIDSSGIADKLNEFFSSGMKYEEAVEKTLQHCKAISGSKWEDDTSLVMVKTRNAITTNILTGPPSSKNMDAQFVGDFNRAPGLKIICGSTTLDVYTRHTGVNAEMVESLTPFEAPTYKVQDIDFASEGAVMLNQLYNLYEINPKNLDAGAPITRLKELLDMSDKICFYLGRAENTEQNESMIFSQLRIFPRHRIIRMLGDKLKELGKVVTVKEY